ncbi:MAG: hypothetical protein Tsb0034_21750 [Ekhidna sp.]
MSEQEISAYDALEHQIDSIMREAIAAEAFPGAVIYVSKGDSVLFYKPYGHHTYDSIRAVDKYDIYDLASITKVMGATLALMKMYDEGLFKLDDKIGDYVDGLGRKVGGVTFREALAHHGGLYPWIAYHAEMRRKNGAFKNKSVSSKMDDEYPFALTDSLFLHRDFYKKIKRLIRKSQVEKEPSYRYSGLFFYLVPELTQQLTGQSFDTFLKKNFYSPLQAKTVMFNPLEKISLERIAPTEVDTFFRMTPIHGKVHDEGAIMMRGVSGNAGLFGNAEDVAKVWRMMLKGGREDTITYLSPQVIDLFTTAQFPNEDNRRGLGFDKPLLEYDSIRSSVAKSASHRSYGHSGYTGTLVWADPDNDLLFIFLSNRVYPTRANRALYNLNVRPTIHQLIYDYLKRSEGEEALPVESTK